jgi:hypothetical protein
MMISQRSALGARTTSVQARKSVVAKAADRPLWRPGSTPPAYLDGSAPGDFGKWGVWGEGTKGLIVCFKGLFKQAS